MFANDAVDITLDILGRPDSVDPASDTTRVLQDRLTSLRSTMIRFHGEQEGAEKFDVLTETVVRVLREGMYGSSLAEPHSVIAPIDQRLVDTLSKRVSASVRGRDVLSSAAIEGASGEIPDIPIGIFKNLSIEQGAPYSYSKYVELQRADDLANSAHVQAVMDRTLTSLGINPESFDRTVRADGGSAISDLFSDGSTGDLARARYGISREKLYAAGTESLLRYSEEIKSAALTDPKAIDKSLGVTINRTASANFLVPQLSNADALVDVAEGRSPKIGSAVRSILKNNTAISGIVAPSDFVDLIKQMTGMTKVKDLTTIGDTTTVAGRIENARHRSAYEAIAKHVNDESVEVREGRMAAATADTLHNYSISPAALAKANLEQQTRELARQRAVLLALGKSAEDLPGFDPMTLDEGGRLLKSDVIQMKDVMLEEQKRVLEELRTAGADVTSLEASINALQSANFDQVKQILRMGSRLIDDYGSVTTAHKIAMEGKDALSAASIKPTRSLIAERRAVADPRYVEDAASFLRTKKIRSLFKELQQLENPEIKKPVEVLATQAKEVKIAIKKEISRGLRVISDIHSGSGANVLDIVDTIEAELQSQFGANAKKFMVGFGLEGEEDLMLQLHRLAESRRMAKSVTYDSRARGLVSRQLDLIRRLVPGTPDLMDITSRQARDMLSKGILPVPTFQLTDSLDNLLRGLEDSFIDRQLFYHR